MTQHSIHYSFWPLLKLYQFTGVFCLEKFESDQLKPMKTRKCLIRYIVTFILIHTSIVLSVGLIGIIDVLKIEANFTNSIIELCALCLLIFALYGLHFSTVWRLIDTKSRLSELLNSLANIQKQQQSQGAMQILLCLILHFVSLLLVMIGYGWSILVKLQNVTFTQTFFYVAGMTFSITWTWAPILSIFIIFSIVCNRLMSWIQAIQTQFENQDMNTTMIMENCSSLYKNGIKKVNQELSLTLFPITTFILIMLVTAFYISISFAFFSGSNGGIQSKMVAAGYLCFSVAKLWSLCYLNSFSQKVSDQVMELREQLTNLSNLEPIVEQSRSKAVQLLNLFHGFDGCGFITFGRPLLTSILTSVVTYTIILVQFKESSSV